MTGFFKINPSVGIKKRLHSVLTLRQSSLCKNKIELGKYFKILNYRTDVFVCFSRKLLENFIDFLLFVEVKLTKVVIQ